MENEQIVLEIAERLDKYFTRHPTVASAAILLRQQHAEIERQAKEIERLKTVPMKYRRMAFNARLQEENAQLSEKIKQLTALMKKGGANERTHST